MRCVYRSFDHTEAEIAAALLREQGCPAYVFENGLSRLYWPYVLAYGGARVTVADADRDAALDILGRWRNGEYALTEDDIEPDALRCPRCQSSEVERDDRRRDWAFALTYLIGLPLLWPAWREHCRACGFRWKAPPAQPPHVEMPAAAARHGDG